MILLFPGADFSIFAALEYTSVKNFQEAILVPKDKVVGGLIDSYVAGAHKDLLSQAKGLKVATVFDHQFAYGFAIANALNDNDVERCLRRQLSTMESEITRTIQEMMEALPVSWNLPQFTREFKQT